MNAGNIIYPIFLECCSFIQDKFWKYIFEDMAYGIFPYGIYINRGFLCCSCKDKEFSYNIAEATDPQLTYNHIHDLFAQKLEIISEIERKNKLSNFKKEEFYYDDWSFIKKKGIHNSIIEFFVIDAKNKYNLTFEQSRKLLELILYMIEFKLISTDDINYKNGKILSIKTIEFFDKKYKIQRKKITTHISFANNANNENNALPSISYTATIFENWEKFLLQLKKYKQCV